MSCKRQYTYKNVTSRMKLVYFSFFDIQVQVKLVYFSFFVIRFSFFDIRTGAEFRILTFKILF